MSPTHQDRSNDNTFSQIKSRVPVPLNRSIWVPKNAELYANSKSEDEIEKKCTDKKLF